MTKPHGKDVQYKPLLDIRQTERAIRVIKEFFQINLGRELNLLRVSAPIAVAANTGVNDNLNGVEMPISFKIKRLDGLEAEIVQSLAKWKRMALADYGFGPGEGIYTDMNCIRPDDEVDETHSIYVDQWDWERVIVEKERNLEFLRWVVERIYGVIRATEKHVVETYPVIQPVLPPTIQFIHTTELERRFPKLSRKERENQVCEEYGAVFLIGVGAALADGKPHDGRAPDYDDWITPTELGPGLNGDIHVWNPVLKRAFELSSMGIRVTAETLLEQLKIRNTEERANLYFHRRLLNGDLPLSIGGGIGQSRLCMFHLRKAHIGEVQCSVWSDKMREDLKKKNVHLL